MGGGRCAVVELFQPTLPLRGATPGWQDDVRKAEFQPTLPLRGATRQPRQAHLLRQVSTHAPLAGSDALGYSLYGGNPEFQPTLPLRGATCSCQGISKRQNGFNPRSPCGERHLRTINAEPRRMFQPTLPLRGATPHQLPDVRSIRFQPTLPLRGATPGRRPRDADKTFQPTLPLRGATELWLHKTDGELFQPTLPLRGAT